MNATCFLFFDNFEVNESVEPVRHMGGYDIVVEFLHQEMGVAFDADFWKFDKCGVAAMSVYGFDKFPGHLQTHFSVTAS